MPTESNYIASVDAGNGGCNAILLHGGKTKTHYEPSVRAVATGDTLGIAGELQYTYVDWYGQRYVTGDDVIKVTRRGLERHMGSLRYGEEFMRFLTAVALAKMGVKDGNVNLSVFAPPGLYKQAQKQILEGFTGDVKITLKGDKQPRHWNYSAINVYPEGIGAAACFLLDEQGQPVDTDIFDGEVVVIDGGAFSLDALQITDGNFNLERLGEATWENAGVHTHIREPLLRKIHDKNADFATVTIDDVDAMIRRGLSTGDYSLKVAGQVLNLENLCKVLFERYADWVSNNICDGMFNGFRGIKSVILIGGAEKMIGDKLRDLYPGKILDPKKYAHTKKIQAVDFNAVGGLRLTLNQLAQAG